LGLSGANLGLGWPGLRLTWPYFRLAGPGRLDLGAVVWFPRSCAGLARADLRLAGTVWHRAWVWTGDTRLGRDGPGSGDDRRTALVDVIKLLTVAGGLALVLDLGSHWRDAWTAHSCNLSWLRSDGDAASATVIGDAVVDGGVVDDHRAVVDVGDAGDVDAIDRTVVVEVVPVPVAAVITAAGVAEAIVDAAVEADVESPEAAMEAVTATVEAPVTGGPKGAVVGRSAPGAWDPVVACRGPAPVAGGPEVVGFRSLGLFVDGERRRRLLGVFNGLAFAFFVELFGVLSVLIRRILIGWRGRSCLLRGVLLGCLLGLGLGANSEDTRRRRGCSRLGLAVIDGGHVGVGWIGAGVVGDWCVCGIGVAVATRYADHGEDA